MTEPSEIRRRATGGYALAAAGWLVGLGLLIWIRWGDLDARPWAYVAVAVALVSAVATIAMSMARAKAADVDTEEPTTPAS